MNLSVLVPLYNTAAYLETCVRSLMQQKLGEEIEFIFVDDDSTDASLDVLRQTIAEYPQRAGQVRIIKQEEHLGVAAARTRAIQEARGEYIGWCDADDWLEPEMYQTMLYQAMAEDADIVCCGVSDHHLDGHINDRQLTYPSDGRTYLRNLYQKTCVDDAMLWNKIFRRSFMSDHHILPAEGINWGEDFNICVRAFYYARRISTVHRCLYHYRFHLSSFSQSQEWDLRWQDGMRNLEFVCGFLMQQPDAAAYRLTCNFLKFTDKQKFNHVYKDRRWEYYKLYKETYQDILHFTGFSLRMRILWMILFSSPVIYIIFKKYCQGRF